MISRPAKGLRRQRGEEREGTDGGGETVESEVERERCKLRDDFSIPTQAK